MSEPSEEDQEAIDLREREARARRGEQARARERDDRAREEREAREREDAEFERMVVEAQHKSRREARSAAYHQHRAAQAGCDDDESKNHASTEEGLDG